MASRAGWASALNNAADAFNEGSVAWKAAKIAETAISTYQSATLSYKSLAGIPVVGPALGAAAAALAVVTGLKQVQKISSTSIKKMPKHFYGGNTGDQAIYNDEFGAVTGVVHADEWVAPKFMTDSPKYAPTINWLENERKKELGQFFEGGNTSTDSPDFSEETETTSVDQGADPLLFVLQDLADQMKKGIRSYTVRDYEDFIIRKELDQEHDQLLKNTKQ